MTALLPAPTRRPDRPLHEPAPEVGPLVDDPIEPAPHEPPPRARDLAGPALLTLAVQWVLAATDRLPSVDALAFLETGHNLLHGKGYTRFGRPDLHFPPLVPATLGALERVTGGEMAAVRTLELTSGVTVIALLVVLAWRLTGSRRATVTVAWLAAAAPGVGVVLTLAGGGSEAPALALELAALAVLLGPPGSHRAGRAELGRLAFAGFLVGLAYLARPEALLLALPMAVWAGARPPAAPTRRAGHRARLLAVSTLLVATAITAGPYVVWLHSHTGSWAPTDKTKDASIAAWTDVARGDRLARDDVLYAISPSGTRLGPPTTSLVTLAAHDPGGWLHIVDINASAALHDYTDRVPGWGPFAWPLLPSVLLVPAVIQLWRGRRRRGMWVVAAMGMLPLATALAFFVLTRYLVPTTALVVLLAGWGLSELPGRRWLRSGLTGAAVALSVVTLAVAIGFPHQLGRNGDPVEQQVAGAWLATHTPPGSRIMTRSYEIQHASHRPVVALPAAPLPQVLAFARRFGVRYLVADSRTIWHRRPGLAHALLYGRTPKGLRRLVELAVDDRRVRIFELVPAPAPTTRPTIPLGYVSD